MCIDKRRQTEEQHRRQKEQSVHAWRPSQDVNASPVKEQARPISRFRRLSSAVELKWWATDPVASEIGQPEQEDMQQVKRNGPVHPSGTTGLQDNFGMARISGSSQDISKQ